LLIALGATAAGVLVMMAGLELAGYDSLAAMAALWRGAFGSWYAFSSATMVRAVPLIVIGLGFAFALQGGALNIGAEGQFYAGAMAATWVGVHADGWPAPVAILTLWVAAGFAGALWVALPVFLKVRYGVFEAISTLLLNFVAISLVSYMVQGPLQEASGIYPQSDQITAAARIPLIAGTRLHWGIVPTVGLAGVIWFVLTRTLWGFHLRAVGTGPSAATITGRINGAKLLAVALLWSAALAGLAGGFEIGGVSYALYQNLSPGYGFTAIAVALLARLNPWAIIVSGVMFGALEAGAGAMQRDAGVPSVAVYVVEAAVIMVALLASASGARAGLAGRATVAQAGT
jgi:simple sugar transport system permease protein